MASFKEIRTRLASVKTTRQITSAMKMVAASKLRRAQDAILNIRPYADKLNEIMVNISSTVDIEENPYSAVRDLQKVLVVVVTSNKGLCGGFNSGILKRTINHVDSNYKDLLAKEHVDFLCIGKKGYDFLRARKYNIIGEENALFDELTFNNVSLVVNRLMIHFTSKRYDRIDIIYNQFKNATVQIVTTEQFLPIIKTENEHSQLSNKGFKQSYIFEPVKEYILFRIIPTSLKIKFYKALLNSHAAEFGARMTAMHQATDNATELLKTLTLDYNKARQASITNEILEIVSGAEALKK